MNFGTLLYFIDKLILFIENGQFIMWIKYTTIYNTVENEERAREML